MITMNLVIEISINEISPNLNQFHPDRRMQINKELVQPITVVLWQLVRKGLTKLPKFKINKE